MERVDRGGETRGFPGKSGKGKMTAAALHELRKQLAGIARRIFSLEHHVGAGRFESAYPSAECRGGVKVGRSADLAQERHRKTPRPRVIEHGATVGEGLFGVR